MKCRICGYELEPGTLFCPFCGSRTGDISANSQGSMFESPDIKEAPRRRKVVEDEEFNWNTYDFPKPRELRDIKMEWSGAGMMKNDASEGFVSSGQKPAEQPRPQPMPSWHMPEQQSMPEPQIWFTPVSSPDQSNLPPQTQQFTATGYVQTHPLWQTAPVIKSFEEQYPFPSREEQKPQEGPKDDKEAVKQALEPIFGPFDRKPEPAPEPEKKEPEIPAVQEEPAPAAEPVIPVVFEDPAKPEEPVVPDIPETPEIPEIPEIPAVEEPEVPEAADEPEMSELEKALRALDDSYAEQIPEIVEEPTIDLSKINEPEEAPAVPEEPVMPDAPAQMDIPAVPAPVEEPEVPAEPEMAEEPAPADIPEEPAAEPEAAEEPAVPGIPETPDEPEEDITTIEQIIDSAPVEEAPKQPRMFNTFYTKNEEFQKLLDQEYQKIIARGGTVERPKPAVVPAVAAAPAVDGLKAADELSDFEKMLMEGTQAGDLDDATIPIKLSELKKESTVSEPVAEDNSKTKVIEGSAIAAGLEASKEPKKAPELKVPPVPAKIENTGELVVPEIPAARETAVSGREFAEVSEAIGPDAFVKNTIELKLQELREQEKTEEDIRERRRAELQRMAEARKKIFGTETSPQDMEDIQKAAEDARAGKKRDKAEKAEAEKKAKAEPAKKTIKETKKTNSNAEVNDYEDGHRHPLLTFVLILLIIAAVFEGGLFALKQYMPDSSVTQVATLVEQSVTGFFKEGFSRASDFVRGLLHKDAAGADL
ncbi:MAG: hypothetical protein IKR93_01250, partial [Firmicutes bacterium]|nr:hypothetical protein [Bacillota bacterium]